MNEIRFATLLASQTNVAQKIFAAVPILEAWTSKQIRDELVRSGIAVTREVKTIEGCINSLVRSGLVIERPPGAFRRVPVTKKPEIPAIKEVPRISTPTKPEPKPAMKTTETTEAKSTMTPIERLASIANRAGTLAAGMRQLASEIETAAIEIKTQTEADAAGRQKLEQLQSILKGVVT